MCLLSQNRAGHDGRGRRSHPVAKSQRDHPQKGDPVVHAPQGRHATARGRREPRKGHRRHLHVGHGDSQSQPGHSVRANTRGQLFRHQGSADALLNYYEFHILPLVNPDGYEYTHNRRLIYF